MSRSINKIESKEDLLLYSLIKFYSEGINMTIIKSIVEQQTTISLRVLDWFVTNYSKKFNVFIDKSVYLDYKRQLKGFSKKQFDPFCRRQRIFIQFNTPLTTKTESIKFEIIRVPKHEKDLWKKKKNGLLTTVGQLNFFRWCIKEKIINYVFEKLDKIELDMLEHINKKKKKNPLISCQYRKIIVSFS